ncbi:MAG: 2-oxo acid dehydrogenase subunit E2 [Ignavibacteriae bacterium]|nr:2-oxo acid dehydrogenase subunit E2 [Ignavibacteriota bacterium]
MAKIEVVMPQLGESLTEGTIIKWHKKPGEKVKKEETLLEVSTDKVDSEIPSPATGIVTKLLFDEQKTVAVRTVIAEIETEEGAAVVTEPRKPPVREEPKEVPKTSVREMERQPKQVTIPTAPKPAPSTGRFYSPLVLNVAREEGISMVELEQIPGTGEGGRVSKKDIFAYVQARKTGKAPAATEATIAAPTLPTPTAPRIETTLKHIDSGELAKKYPAPLYEILQMSNILQKMSEHMVRSVHTSPHVQAVHECDMTKVDAARRRNAEAFEKREGFKLTYMPFICDAIIKALKQFPLVNSSIEGDKIILKRFVNLGIAVASENGLIVPVIKNADEKNFVGLARAINDLATRARTKRLIPSDIEGGTFTITNYGVFGTMIGIPIINQPQVAILGTGAIKKRPVIINDAIAIRSMAYFTLSFDHRIVDGALGGSFLETIVKNIENFDEAIVL